MSKSLLVAASLSAAALAAAAPAGAAVLTFQQGVAPTSAYAHLGQDIRSAATSNNSGNTVVGRQVAGVEIMRTVLAFDLSAIPAGSTVTGVTLAMTVNDTGVGTPAALGTVEVREAVPNAVASNNMVEGQVTYTVWKTGSNWSTAGGDFGATLSTAAVNDANADNAFTNGERANFGTSAAFATAAQNALDGGQPLELVLLAPTAEAATSTVFVRFGSDDATTLGNRPLLTVTYDPPVPEPTGLAIAGVAAAGLLGRRRARR